MSSPAKDSVERLLLRIKKGDVKAREELFGWLGDKKRFGAAVRSMARKFLYKAPQARRLMDTEDLAQSAIRTGMRHIPDFAGATEGQFFAWFQTILRTKVNRVIRRKEPRAGAGSIDSLENGRNHTGEDPLSRIIDQELRDSLQAAISKLPLGQRIVVELRLRGFTTAEICEKFGLRPETIRKRESRAVEALKSLMK